MVCAWRMFSYLCIVHTVPSSTSSSKMDPDPDPALFVSELQDANKNKFVNFLLITF
jgi:hypothetical protein